MGWLIRPVRCLLVYCLAMLHDFGLNYSYYCFYLLQVWKNNANFAIYA